MRKPYIQLHPNDNVLVALDNLEAGEIITFNGVELILRDRVPAKHKFAASELKKGDAVFMYGVLVGKASQDILKADLISSHNLTNALEEYITKIEEINWTAPDVSGWEERTFEGYYRKDGQVGTANYWLVIPLTFCENRNIEVLKCSMSEALGYVTEKDFTLEIQPLVKDYKEGASEAALLDAPVLRTHQDILRNRVFQNVDGIKFLPHEGGCGGTKEDSETLGALLAGYITHPNVAGATILSLGCQHLQIPFLQKCINKNDPSFSKPLVFLEQQESKSEQDFLAVAVKKTFVGLIDANKIVRKPAPLSKLTLGLECGGSDGFSGISANPALGYVSDMLVALGGIAILSEFPELNGVEQNLLNRCVDMNIAEKFASIMKHYSDRAIAVGSGFTKNPSPGNIKDGLITNSMKSAGAAKKGGTSPVTDVLDFTEQAIVPGLNLLCTPGNDVESTTGLAGSGANVIVFTTGLGTPTGNPICPVVKVSSNSTLFERMKDIIDFDAGSVISGEESILSLGEKLMDYIIEVASGRAIPAAVRHGQNDFIPWKRGVSL